MKAIFRAAALSFVLATGAAGPVLGTAAVASAAETSAFAGTWSGKTAKGGSVVIKIPAKGTPSYTFRGERVPVNSAKLSGKTYRLNVGSGGGTVKLTLKADGTISYSYSFQGSTASAMLTKS